MLRPDEIRDLDMALRYSVIHHDYGCPNEVPVSMGRYVCECGARSYRDRSAAILKRVGAPYRNPSGDYDESTFSEARDE